MVKSDRETFKTKTMFRKIYDLETVMLMVLWEFKRRRNGIKKLFLFGIDKGSSDFIIS